MATPWLVRRGLAIPEVVEESMVAHRGHLESARLTRGDWIEILGLAAATCVLTLMLTFGRAIETPAAGKCGAYRCC